MVDIRAFTEQADGSALVTIELTYDELVTFAKAGIIHALTSIAESAIVECNDEGSDK
jgi:hypothetical protein